MVEKLPGFEAKPSRRAVQLYPFKFCKIVSLDFLKITPLLMIKHKSNYTGKEYNITAPIDCNTKSVVYKLTCKKARCRDFVYVGQTERRCKDRFYDHKS